MRRAFLHLSKSLSHYSYSMCTFGLILIRRVSSRTKADRARQLLGWNPLRGEDEFISEIREVVAAMYDEKIKSG